MLKALLVLTPFLLFLLYWWTKIVNYYILHYAKMNFFEFVRASFNKFNRTDTILRQHRHLLETTKRLANEKWKCKQTAEIVTNYNSILHSSSSSRDKAWEKLVWKRAINDKRSRERENLSTGFFRSMASPLEAITRTQQANPQSTCSRVTSAYLPQALVNNGLGCNAAADYCHARKSIKRRFSSLET